MKGPKPVTMATVIIGIVAISAILYAVQGCTNQPASPPGKAGASSPPANQAALQPGKPEPSSQPTNQPTSQPGNPQVVMETSLGRVVLELDAERTPATTANFLTYVDEKFYDGIIFHRVIQQFMIQAGGFTPGLQKKESTHPPVRNESRGAASNVRYTIAMARTDNPNSATSQFFINTKGNENLDYSGGHGGYCVFGRVIEGMDVVDRIAAVPVQPSQISEAQPLEDVTIKSIHRK